MKHVQKRNVAAEFRNGFFDVVKTKIDVPIIFRGYIGAVTDLASVGIEANHSLPAAAFAQIESQ